jgi:hypothetical protein
VDSSGAVQWTANGAAICTASSRQDIVGLISDGSGGAIITWSDDRTSQYDIYAQRVDSSGAVQWTADGVAICMASGTQWWPQLTSDGSGGAIITWQDKRSGTNYDIYAQRVDSNGTVMVNNATPLSLVASSNPSTFGKSVTLKATVKSSVIPSPGIPTGTVYFMDGTNLLGEATLSRGTATLKVTWLDIGTTLDVGTHSITAIYGGDANFIPSTSAALPQEVQKAKPSMGLKSSDSSSVSGQSVTFNATIASRAGIPSGTVQFMDNDAILGDPVALSSGVATYVTSDLSAGVHAITAVYSGDDNFISTSKTRWQVVK